MIKRYNKEDPVCGMYLGRFSREFHSHYKGTEFFFCSTLCRLLFERHPEKYIPVATATDQNYKLDIIPGESDSCTL